MEFFGVEWRCSCEENFARWTVKYWKHVAYKESKICVSNISSNDEVRGNRFAEDLFCIAADNRCFMRRVDVNEKQRRQKLLHRTLPENKRKHRGKH